jgi:serine/threonine-protein kinase HipA
MARIGIDDLPGAVQLGTADELSSVKRPPELEAAEDEEGRDNPLLKFSLAGAQLKFSIYRGSKGLTVPAKGLAGNVIVKLPDNRPGHFGIPEAELACLNLARLSGIDTPQASLVSISDIAGLEDWTREASAPALAVDRFDRTEHGRIHMEELAQVLNIPAAVEMAKYRRANFETIASIVGALCGPASIGDVITRIVFNILIGNGDAHLKNWAILYPDGITPTFSPIYDVVPTVLFIHDDNMGLKLSGSRSFERVGTKSFDEIGRRTSFGVESARACAHEAVERILENWASLGDALPTIRFDDLTSRLNRLALVRRVLLVESSAS